MTIETLAAEQFIASRLRADSALMSYLPDGTNGVFADVIPVESAYPVVQILYYSGVDLHHLGNEHIWSDLYYIVRGVCEGGSFVPLREIVQRICSVLDGSQGSSTDGVIFGMVRTAPFRMTENDGERQFRHLGAFFRIFVKES